MRVPFDPIVDRYGEMVLRVARALVGSADADDVWQETFLAALRAWPGLDESVNTEAWLVTVAKRRSIDLLRKRGREPIPVSVLPEIPARMDGSLVGDAELIDALSKLTGHQRRCVAYHHLVGLPFVEVAGILGIDTAAARRASADGIKRLRGILVPEAERGVETDG